MNNSRAIRLSLPLLLIVALAANVSAQEPSPLASSQSLSPALTSARELLNELGMPSKCDPSDTICVAEDAGVRLEAAMQGIRSLMRAYREEEGITATKDRHIEFQDKIIAKYEKLDVNSQRIDTLGQDSKRLYEAQVEDARRTIGELKSDLDSCRANQKWYFAIGAVAGGVAGYKIRSAGQFQNPFASASANKGFMINLDSERLKAEREKIIRALAH